jgi:heptosyltransferase-3
MTKILIIKFRHIGDVLLSTPLVASLKATFPESQIDLAVNDYCAAIVEHHPDISAVFSYPRKEWKKLPFWNRLRKEIGFLHQFSNKYDMVINLTEGDRGHIISAISGAEKRFGYVKSESFLSRIARYDGSVDWGAEAHTVEKDLSFLSFLDHANRISRVQVGTTPDDDKQVVDFLEKNKIDGYVVIHPVSRGLYKCWAADRFAKVVDYIEQEAGLRVVLTSSPDPVEVEILEKVISECKSQPLVTTHDFSLTAYKVLVERAQCFVGIDSAPMHIAASTNTPVIALFGASKPHLWGPWDNVCGAGYTFSDGVQHSGKNTVIAKIDYDLFGTDGYKREEYEIDIPASQVLTEVKRVLAG